MWINRLVLFCCFATASVAIADTKSKKKSSESRGKRNLEYSLAHPHPIHNYRGERRISTGLRSAFFPPHRHYITFRRPVPSPPPYAVQMEPLVHYSQRDPLYDGGNLPLTANNDLVADYNHVRANILYGPVPPPAPKIIEKPIYIKEPEPIIEIIIKESNTTLPPPPAPIIVTPAPKKEPVHVFYVKYKKNPNGYGKDSIIYDKPIPAISPPIEDEEPQQQEAPQTYIVSTTPAPPPPSTTLRAIIKPEYSGAKHIHVRFGKQHNENYKRASEDDSKEESAPEPVISQPQSREFLSVSPPPLKRPPNFPPKIHNGPPPPFRTESQRFPPPPPVRPITQPPPPFKSFFSNLFSQQSQFSQSNRPPFQSPQKSQKPSLPPPPPFQQQLPSNQHTPFRQPVPYKPFDNYTPATPSPSSQPHVQPQRPIQKDSSNTPPPQSFSNVLTFPEKQHVPHVQRQHIFHPPPQQQQQSNQQNQPQKQFPFNGRLQQQLPQPQRQHTFNGSPFNQQQQIPQSQKQQIFNAQQQQQYSQQQQSQQHQQQNLQQQQTYQQQQQKTQQQFAQFQQKPQQQFARNQQQTQQHTQSFESYNRDNQQNRPLQQQQQFLGQKSNDNQNLLYQNQLPPLPQYQLLPSPQRLTVFNNHQQQQQENVPPGGQLIASVSKYEQHITLPTDAKEQSHQQQSQQVRQQQATLSVQEFQQQVQQQFQQPLFENRQQLNQQQNFQTPSSTQRTKPFEQPSNYLQNSQVITQPPHRFSPVYTTTSRSTFSSTTTEPTTTTTTQSPEQKEKTQQNILQLPDEVPDDLREQLLSSGILENAHISVLDYDKIGDIPLAALPPEHIANFFNAGGDKQISASEPVPSVVRKNGEKVEEAMEVDLEPEGSEIVEEKVSSPEIKVVQYDGNSESGQQLEKSYFNENATQLEPVILDGEKYTRYLPLKVNGAEFPIPDVPELKGKNITSVVVLAPVEYSSNNGRPVREAISNNRLLAAKALKELIRNPSSENFQKWLDIENKTSVDKQSVVLLVTEPEETSKEKEIFMYDLGTQTVSKVSGELSTAFVEAAESNSSEDLEILAPSNIVETRIPYSAVDRKDVNVAEEDIQDDLSKAPSDVYESKIPIIDPMEEKDEYEAEASEQLEQFVDISGLKVKLEDLSVAASDDNTVEDRVLVSSGYSKSGKNLPSST